MPKKSNTQEFIEKSQKIHNYKYDYSLVSYITRGIKVIIICDLHGKFSQTPHDHLDGNGCTQCGFILRGKKNTLSINNFLEKAKAIHGDKYDYSLSIYLGSKKNIKIICKIHGSFELTPHTHLRGANCHKCMRESANEKIRYTPNEFIEQAKLVHKDKYDYSMMNYIGCNIKINIICKNNKHGNFWQMPVEHLRGFGCQSCGRSSISTAENDWLDSLNIKKEYRQKTIRLSNEKYFRVDAFDPETNTIYEYNGDFWHGNPNVYPPDGINNINKEKVGDLLRKTIEKENFLKSAGYNVISKWETDLTI